jgi:hypothetical protein
LQQFCHNREVAFTAQGKDRDTFFIELKTQ